MEENIQEGYNWRKGPTPEQQEGLRKHQEEFDERCNAVNRIHSYISPARQKAIDFVMEKKKKDDFYKAWFEESGNS